MASLADQPAGARALVEALEAVITSRRSVKEFLPRPVPRDLIGHLIDVSVWAPNHRLTEPWRYYVFDGVARQGVGEVARALTRAQLTATGGADPALVERKAAEAAATWASVPALLYVTVLTDPNPDLDLENYGAACIAVQHIMLMAHAHGLATSWSSGAVAASADLRTLAGAGADERMVGLIRLGYPTLTPTPRTSRRTAGTAHLVWVGEPA